MYWHFVKHNYVLSLNYYHGIYIVFFFTVNSSVNAVRSSLNTVCWRKLHGKSIQLKTFPQGNVISPCGVVINNVFRLIIVVTYSSIEPKVQRSSPTQYFIFFSFFVLFCLLICVVVFYKYLPK